MSNDLVLVNGILVQGEVTFTISVDTLVDMDTYRNRLKEFILDKALDLLDSSDDEVEIINEVNVTLSEETFNWFVGNSLSDKDWSKIIQEKRKYIKS